MVASGDLPQDLMADILSKLPVRSLLRFSCVHKTWYSLFKSRSFITFHLQNSSNKDCGLIFLFIQNIEEWSYRLPNYSPSNACLDLKIPFDETSHYSNVVGSCHGLVCFYERSRRHGHVERLILCNLSLKQHKIIHLPPLPLPEYAKRGRIGAIGFGYDSINDDYKLVKVDNHSGCVKVYTLGMDLWRTVGSTDIIFDNSRHQAYLNGAIHWLGRKNGRSYVVRFDVSSEVLQLFSLPNCVAGFDVITREAFQLFSAPNCVDGQCLRLNVGIYGDLLSLVQTVRRGNAMGFDVWVMGEYGVEESWNRVHANLLFPIEGDFIGFGMHKELFVSNGSLAVYHPETEQVVNIEFDEFDVVRGCIAWVESLVSPQGRRLINNI